jgi:hypothetical protein
MRRHVALLALLALPAPLACHDRPPAPGYSGPIVGALAQGALHSLEGRKFQDVEGVLGGGTWTVSGFSVTPYPDGSGEVGPHLVLCQGEHRLVLPMQADGDAADVYRRVCGTPHPQLTTRTSSAYRAALARAAAPR